MRGSWLVKIGSWIARRETFERMVAPAISDMQVEASYGRMHRWKHYVAIGLVLVYAWLQDLRLDFVSAFNAEARRFAWKRAAIWYAACVALMTILGLQGNLPAGLPMDGIWPAAFTFTALEGIVTGVMVGISVAVFYLYRRSASGRSIVLVVLIAAALTCALSFAVRPIRMSAAHSLYDSIQSRMTPARHIHYMEESLNPEVAWWQDLQSGVWVIPHSIIGVVLARRKGWKPVAFTYFCVLVSWMLEISVLRSLGSNPPPSLILQRWRDIALISVVAVSWLSMDNLFRRVRQLGPK